MKIKLLVLLALTLFALLMTGCNNTRNNNRETNVQLNGNNNHVTIYRDCGD